MFRFLSFISLLAICNSCTNTKGSNAFSVNAAAENDTDTIKYAYNTVLENSKYIVHDNETLDTTYFKITYPVFEQKKLNDSIQKHILIDGENTPSEAAMAFIDGFEEFAGDQHTNNINGAWFKEVNSQVILNTPLLISLSTQVVEYSGGAHGQHYNLYANYDISDNRTIHLKEIVHENKYTELTKIAEKIFRKQEQLDDSMSLAKDFFFEDGIFTLNDNFGLSKDALIIYFNEYEIRPYAYGATKLEIPYKDLNGIFNDRGQKYIKSIL